MIPLFFIPYVFYIFYLFRFVHGFHPAILMV